MKTSVNLLSTLFSLSLLAVTTSIVCAVQDQNTSNDDHPMKGTAVAYPWMYENGTPTARATARQSAEEILRRAGYASVPGDVATAAWKKGRWAKPRFGRLPSVKTLLAFGRAVHAKRIIYGSVSWHTRSIWVNAGPKTISTATVNAYVFDVPNAMVVFKRTSVKGRSDEKSNGYKIAADVLFTPLVTAVSGGPATPHEQRAVQIGMGTAFSSWINPTTAMK